MSADTEVSLFSFISYTSRYVEADDWLFIIERYGFGSLTPEAVVLIRQDLNNTVLPRHLSFFETVLSTSTSGWLAGGETPSIADFILVPRLQWLASGANDGIAMDILDSYPHVKAMMAKFMALPAVVEYYNRTTAK